MTTLTEDQTTATPARRPWERRMDFEGAAPGFARAMAALDRAAVAQADEAGLDRKLRELVRLRASQLNGCAYCVDMHAKDAREAGDDNERIDSVSVWREALFYIDAERAALELSEAITLCSEGHVPEAVWEAAAVHYKPAALAGLVVAVNAWNRIGASTRAFLAGSYKP
jgi:AhpD family alkylhydroperoxidase